MAIDIAQTLPTRSQGQCTSQCQLESIEVNLKYHISPYLLASFKQCFIGIYARGCSCSSQSGRVTDCILGHLVGS